MANYIHYTQEQKDRARTTDIVDLLERQGERLKRSGKEYQWRDGSEKVTIRGNLWYHQYEEVGGDAIDFVRKFYNKNYPEAMEYLLNGYGGTLTAALPIEQKERLCYSYRSSENCTPEDFRLRFLCRYFVSLSRACAHDALLR